MGGGRQLLPKVLFFLARLGTGTKNQKDHVIAEKQHDASDTFCFFWRFHHIDPLRPLSMNSRKSRILRRKTPFRAMQDYLGLNSAAWVPEASACLIQDLFPSWEIHKAGRQVSRPFSKRNASFVSCAWTGGLGHLFGTQKDGGGRKGLSQDLHDGISRAIAGGALRPFEGKRGLTRAPTAGPGRASLRPSLRVGRRDGASEDGAMRPRKVRQHLIDSDKSRKQ